MAGGSEEPIIIGLAIAVIIGIGIVCLMDALKTNSSDMCGISITRRANAIDKYSIEASSSPRLPKEDGSSVMFVCPFRLNQAMAWLSL